MKTLHMIGNAHLDPVWLWRWQEGYQENIATFRSALERLIEYDDVVFTSSSAQFYKWIEQHDKQLFAQIRERVQQKRWVICGGWWVQADCNLPSGESFARQALIAQNYFKEKFGIHCRVGYNVDSFGHNGALPQLLRLSAMDRYVFMRPGPHEKQLPGRNFIWESRDGSQVLAFRIPVSYGTFGEMREHVQLCMMEFDEGIDDLMCFFGVGNHGGGPTIENIEDIKHLQKTMEGVDIVFDDPDSYFTILQNKHKHLPVVRGDLQHHAVGCYSVMSEVKQLNRRAENALLRAEKICVIGNAAANCDYPKDFALAWKNVLFNQFHDILAGSAIVSAYDDARDQYGESLSIAARNENAAFQAIASSIHIEPESSMRPFVAFHPHAWEAEVAIEVETGNFLGQLEPSYTVKNHLDENLPCQVISAKAKMKNRNRIVFVSKMQAMGYATFRIYPGDASAKEWPNTEPMTLENGLLRVTFDHESGGICSIYDKLEHFEYVAGISARPVVIEDTSDTWAHDVTKFDQAIGNFSPVKITLEENGPVRSTICITSTYKRSTLVQRFTLYQGSYELEVSANLNWQEHQKCLKLEFPCAFEDCHAVYDIPFGSIAKECDGLEEPMQRWVVITGKAQPNARTCGLCVINDGKYSASAEQNTLRIMVTRSPVYAHHTPYTLPLDLDDSKFVDIGMQSFRYALVPFIGTLTESSIIRRAEEFNQPCIVTTESYHDGYLPQTAQYMRITSPNILLSALKMSERENGWVLRCYESDGIETETEIELFQNTISTRFDPYEIKSFLVESSGKVQPQEVNFLEWELDKSES